MTATFWALLPPILAIIIALITKEVNLSLMVGILIGGLLYTSFNPFEALIVIFNIMGQKIQGNIGVIVFIILLGMIIHLMGYSGASKKYAHWASQKLKNKKQVLLSTLFLGIIIFVDDYFNCMTVGTVMRPITDKYKISREKLAYVIDSTAAPICMIAPLSSWAAAVSSSMPDGSSIDGFTLFIKTIACNYYTWLSLAMILFTTLFVVDFGPMKEYEQKAAEAKEAKEDEFSQGPTPKNCKVYDLLLPVFFLIVLSIFSMLYTGGFFSQEGVSIGDAFANCDAIVSLAMGALFAVILVAILYLPREIVSPKNFMNALVEGFRSMVPTTLILTFAWTLSGICGSDYLDAGSFVAGVVERNSIPLSLMPAILFVVSLLLAFSTGTSWGTFGILIPITVSVFGDVMSSIMVMTTAAVLGGSVCGDHLSPISDTTILSSAGAGCKHLNHVASQLPYGITVAAISFVFYIVAGLVGNSILGLVGGIVALFVFVFVQKAGLGKAQ
jgi:Na+/H+ antiporter NhaC